MDEETLTLIWQLLRKLEMMDWVGCGSLRLESSILYMSPLCHTLSNAFSMSKNIARVISFLLRFLWMSSDKRRMLSVLALPFLKLAWWIAIRPIDSMGQTVFQCG